MVDCLPSKQKIRVRFSLDAFIMNYHKVFTYLASFSTQFKKLKKQLIFGLKGVQGQKIMPYVFALSLALLILSLIVSELYFLILDI